MNTNNLVIILGFILVVGALVYLLITGKLSPNSQPNVDCDLDQDLDKAGHKSIAQSAYNSLSPYNLTSTSQTAIYQQLIALKRGDLCATAKVYNNKYRSSEYPTLRLLIEGEFQLWYTDNYNLKQELLAKLAGVNL